MKLIDRKTSCGPHETQAFVHSRGERRAVLVTLHAGHMELRLKGCRQSLVGSYEGIYWHLAKLTANAGKRGRDAG